MKTFYRYLAIGIVSILFFVAFASTHRIQSIDDLSYVVALGIDAGTNDKLKVTFQFTMPNSSGENISGETAPSVIDSVEAPSIDAAINLMNTYVSKEMNLAHCKVIVFSEELAMEGIKEEIYSLANKIQVRPDTNIVISTSSAEEYIESVHPSLENLVTKFYAILPNSSQYTGYTANVELGQFMNQIMSLVAQPIAILGNVIPDGSNSNSDSSGTSSESKDSGNEVAIKAKNGIENIGIAVFRQDKMVGSLTPLETLSHLIVTNEIINCNISVPDTKNEENTLDLFFTFNSTPQINVSILNGTPYVKVKIEANAKISSVKQLASNITNDETKQIEISANNYLNKLLSHYLYKTSKELNSDCANLGKSALKNFNTVTELQNYNWLEHYQDAFFKVDCNVHVDSGVLLTGV